MIASPGARHHRRRAAAGAGVRTEPRLLDRGLTNYWGYNTLNFFTPHGVRDRGCAQGRARGRAARVQGHGAALYAEAGIEVILDVVYNHTNEEGIGGPREPAASTTRSTTGSSRTDSYIDTTGCGNTLDTATRQRRGLVLDSLRYWTTGAGRRIPLRSGHRPRARRGERLHAGAPAARRRSDGSVARRRQDDRRALGCGFRRLADRQLPTGWSEWNDRYRDRVRNFWLSDIDYARRASAPTGIGGFANRLAGSVEHVQRRAGPARERQLRHGARRLHPARSVSYDVKHNEANGEQNRDGADTNRSFNHGAEPPTTPPSSPPGARRCAICWEPCCSRPACR
jgi:glycogen operon protein